MSTNCSRKLHLVKCKIASENATVNTCWREKRNCKLTIMQVVCLLKIASKVFLFENNYFWGITQNGFPCQWKIDNSFTHLNDQPTLERERGEGFTMDQTVCEVQLWSFMIPIGNFPMLAYFKWVHTTVGSLLSKFYVMRKALDRCRNRHH